MIDLHDFISLTEDESAQQIIALLDELVVYNHARASRAGGVSIYYPYYEVDFYNLMANEMYDEYDYIPNYNEFIYDFVEISCMDDIAASSRYTTYYINCRRFSAF